MKTGQEKNWKSHTRINNNLLDLGSTTSDTKTKADVNITRVYMSLKAVFKGN